MTKHNRLSRLLAAPLLFLACPGTALAAAPAAAPTAAPALPDADPALWVVKDSDTTIYLFGTFHALDGKTDWFNDEVKAAFDRSSELVLEIVQPENPATLQPLIMKYALDQSGTPLSSKLTPAGREKLVKALAGMGAPPAAFDKMRPFFAALTLTVAETQKLGLTSEQGAEATLTKAAKAGGKSVSSLETPEFQIAMFDALPEPVQVRMLEQTLDELGKLPDLFGQMQKSWNAGDADGFAAIMKQMEAQTPEAYKVVIADRNAAWSQWVGQRLAKPGIVFLAVGAGHLGGKDSVQSLLAARGISAQRVPAI